MEAAALPLTALGMGTAAEVGGAEDEGAPGGGGPKRPPEGMTSVAAGLMGGAEAAWRKVNPDHDHDQRRSNTIGNSFKP